MLPSFLAAPHRGAALIGFTSFVLLACGEPPLSPRSPTPGAPHFTVLTYNIHLGAAGQPRTLEAVSEMNADIACLQEVTPAAEEWMRQNLRTQYPHQAFKAKSGAGGLAVLSRFPLVSGELRAAREGWHPSWHLEALTPAGRLHLINVHLRSMFTGGSNFVSSYVHRGEDHLEELHHLSDWSDDEIATIVLGDFNEPGSGEAIQFLEGLGFLNVLPAFRPGQPTWRFRSPGGQFDEPIDHILIDEDLTPLNAWVERRGDSDHLPVLAHLEPLTW